MSDSRIRLLEEMWGEEDNPLPSNDFMQDEESEEQRLDLGIGSEDNDERSTIETRPSPSLKRISSFVSHITRRSSSIRLPRIPKNDIRRKYPMMLLNTLNSMDSSLLHKFLSMFIHPQTVFKRQIMSPLHPNLESSSVSFNGPTEIFSFLHLVQFFGPDRVIKLDNSTIVTRSNTHLTEIRLECTFDVHYLYDWDAITVQKYIYETCGHFSSAITSASPDIQILSLLQEGLPGPFTYLENPRGYRFRPTFKLLIYNVYSREKLDEILFQLSSV